VLVLRNLWKSFKDRLRFLRLGFPPFFSESGCKGNTFFHSDKFILKKYFTKYDKCLTVNEIFFSNTLLSVAFAFPLVLHVFADCVLTVNPFHPVRTESVTGYADGPVPRKEPRTATCEPSLKTVS
jgi:hypothetical protein